MGQVAAEEHSTVCAPRASRGDRACVSVWAPREVSYPRRCRKSRRKGRPPGRPFRPMRLEPRRPALWDVAAHSSQQPLGALPLGSRVITSASPNDSTCRCGRYGGARGRPNARRRGRGRARGAAAAARLRARARNARPGGRGASAGDSPDVAAAVWPVSKTHSPRVCSSTNAFTGRWRVAPSPGQVPA